MTLTKIQFRITLLDDGVRFSKGGKSTSVVDDLADNPRNRGNYADDFVDNVGCTSSLSPLGQLALELKAKQQARLVASTKLQAGIFDDGSFDIAKKLCASWTDDFANFKQTQEAGKYLDLLPLETNGATGIRFKPEALGGSGKPDFTFYRVQGRASTGLKDAYGRVWIPDDSAIAQGKFHWDVQVPNSKTGRWDHINVNPDGTINHGSN